MSVYISPVAEGATPGIGHWLEIRDSLYMTTRHRAIKISLCSRATLRNISKFSTLYTATFPLITYESENYVIMGNKDVLERLESLVRHMLTFKQAFISNAMLYM